MKIKVQDIDFAYNGKNVLNSVNTEIKAGELVSLVGPNGSGKSTFIKCLNGILKIKKGFVNIDSKSIAKLSSLEIAQEIAYVPQSSKKNSSLSVFDTILLGRKPYIKFKPSKRDIAIVNNIIHNLNIDDIAFKDFDKLSGGQQQIVVIARALAQDAKIILLDEPTSNLDIKHQLEVLEILKELSEVGITIIVAIHDINLAVKYSDKFLMLKEGNVFNFGGKEIIKKDILSDLYDVNLKVFTEEDNIYIVTDKNIE